jgi:RNA polymerase sigma-70 factor (ECF subfamily)
VHAVVRVVISCDHGTDVAACDSNPARRVELRAGLVDGAGIVEPTDSSVNAENEPSCDPLEQTTASLARNAGADRDRFAHLYGRVAPSVAAWASLRMTPSLRKVLDVEDVVQEVWYRALADLPSYDPGRSSFRTWVFAIANHVILKGYRLLGRGGAAPRPEGGEHDLAEIPEDITSISQRLARDETLERCVGHVARLDEDDRELVIHCGLEGLPARQVGRLIGISPEAVVKRWQRLRERLRELTAFKDLLAP